VEGASMSTDGSRVAWSLSLQKPKAGLELRVWDAATGRDVWTRDDWSTRNGTTQLGRPIFSRDGRTLVVANKRETPRYQFGNPERPGSQCYILNAATGADLRLPLSSPDGPLVSLRVSADGRRLFALASQQRASVPVRPESVVVWDLVTGRKLLTLPVRNTN